MAYYINDDCIDCAACQGVCPVNAILDARPPIMEPYISLIAAINALTQAVKDLMYQGQELSIPLPDGPELTLKFTSRTASLLTQ